MRSILNNTTVSSRQVTAITVERERESNSLTGECAVADDKISWRGIVVLAVFFVVAIAVCVICGLNNMANAASQDVAFKGVTFNNGATLHLNGDKSLTAIDGGNRLIANNLGTATRGVSQQVGLSDYSASNYGDDALASNNVISNPKSLSEAELNANRTFMPTVSGDYWLSNLYTRSQLKWASYSTSSNRLAYNTLYATGRDGNYWYDNTPIARGSYKWAGDFWLGNYTSPYGWSWSVSGTGQQGGFIYLTENSYFGNGTKVYNNPQCLETGTDEYGNPNRATYVQNLASGSDRKFFGKVSSDGRRLTYATAIGSRITSGTVLYFGFLKSMNELRDPTGFASPTGSYYVGFIKTTRDNQVKTWAGFNRYPLPGFIKQYDSNQRVTAPAVLAPTLPVRPAYDADYSNIAFTRPATSGETLSGIGTFGDAPKSVNNNGDDVKAVVKSESVTITNNLTTNRVTADRPNVTYANDKIRVPYGAKTLSFDPQAFTTSNASYVSALASTENLQNYAVCGTPGVTLRMNLENILNTSQVGSTATVSFYAEKTNSAKTTDLISKTPVTVQLEVVDGTEQTITYALDGGVGTAPASDKVKSGRTYTMANGTGLSRDGNPFSSWQLTYLPYGEANTVTRFVAGNESIVVPETSDGRITATAVYAGVKAMKTTESSSSVVTVTWDANSPENANAKFTDAATGEYNTARTKKYDKIKVAGASVIVPTESDLEIDVTKIFDGWWTTRDESGTKLSDSDVQISPTANVTYYAHWMDGYRVTYDATGGSGLVDPSIAGKFVNDATKLTESVLPGDALQGPKINGSAAEPVPADSTVEGYKFMGWFTQPNGGGTKAVLGKTKVTESITYYAHLVKGYKVTYDASGGPGATQTGKWSDGATTDVEVVLPGASTKGPSKGTPVADNSSYMFYGWFPQLNGGGTEVKAGTSFATLGGSKTVYAYYGLANTFLAPATSTVTANPRNISGTKYSIAQVKAAANSIKSGTNPDSTVYNATNDSYHLYTLLKDSSGKYLDASLTDSWAEFRIIGVGSHDSDGSGLTFQMVHGMPSSTGWAFDSTGKTDSSLNWANSALRPLLQRSGSIYNQFDTQLTSSIMSVAKKYNTTAGSKPTSSTISTISDAFTILSYTEYQKSVNTSYWSTGQVGTTYAFWNQYTIANDSSQTLDPLQKLCYSRSNVINKGTYQGYVWQRSVSPSNPLSVLRANFNGTLDSYGRNYQVLNGVVLSFSL